MEFHEEFKKVLDRIDELSVLLNTLNRIIGQEDYQTDLHKGNRNYGLLFQYQFYQDGG